MTDIYTTDKKYSIIYADPPWQYFTYSKKGQGRSAESHYPTMPKSEIQKLPIPRISAKDSVLFLWATAPCLIEAFELIEAWGYTYKTVGFTWIKRCRKSDKLFLGMGYYTRANAEYCLLATKGRVLERKSHSVSSVIISHIREHSRKPDEARERIVELFGDIPRIELFARESMSGWDCWGNETEKFNAEMEHGREQKALSRINPRTERGIKELLN